MINGWALDVIDHGLSIISHNSERILKADLYRLKARALLMRVAPDERPPAATGAIARASRGNDLARLWMTQGKRAEARDVLSSIYGCFGESFDTRDLKEAKAVLVQLQ